MNPIQIASLAGGTLIPLAMQTIDSVSTAFADVLGGQSADGNIENTSSTAKNKPNQAAKDTYQSFYQDVVKRIQQLLQDVPALSGTEVEVNIQSNGTVEVVQPQHAKQQIEEALSAQHETLDLLQSLKERHADRRWNHPLASLTQGNSVGRQFGTDRNSDALTLRIPVPSSDAAQPSVAV